MTRKPGRRSWPCAARTHPGCFQCPECEEYLPKYDNNSPSKNGITIDHRTNYRVWIHDNAEPDDHGHISSKAAQDAYNDTRNLQPMCRDCNSSKNAPRGVF
ncbi:GH-E family nuclease [Krasilnikovia sp. MM14-A1004]|uniref:GH-E family nuclease n=1 Tax=Krasilnikovia sp. MM14-A1004 TaxID=3373541 RepID=UPI00399D429F